MRSSLDAIINSMNRYRLLLSIILLLLISPRVMAADKLHQELDVFLAPDDNKVKVRATLSLDNFTQQWPGEFILAEQAAIEQVRAAGKELKYSFANGRLRVSGLNRAHSPATSYSPTSGSVTAW